MLSCGPSGRSSERALWVAACPDEANEFFDYMTTSAAGSLDRGGDLRIMFGIGGERDLTERELPHLKGWRHSAPVRPEPDSQLGHAASSTGPLPSSTTSACSLRRSIPTAESSWATFPKPLAPSGSSTRPGPSSVGAEPEVWRAGTAARNGRRYQ
jgi:hypothetical protein